MIDSLCLDLSNYDESTCDAAALYASGVRRVIVGCQNGGEPARRMIPKLRAADIEVIGTYGFLAFRDWYRDPTQQACDVANQFGVPWVWLDCEADTVGGAPDTSVTPDQRNDRLAACVADTVARSLKCGIYTAPWWWVPQHGDTTAFSHLPLWLADYGRNDGLKPPVETVGFGGWAKVAIHQYTSNVERAGRVRDHNYILDPAVAGQAEEDFDVTGMERLERMERLLADDILVDVDDNNVAALRTAGIPDPIAGTRIKLSGEKALAFADAQGMRFWLGLEQTQERVGALEAK